MRRAALLVIAIAGCGADDEAAVRSFRFTAPSGAAEIVPVPGRTVAVAWQAEVTGAVQAAIELRPVAPTGAPIALGTVAAEAGAMTWTVPDPAPRGGIYQLAARLVDDGGGALDDVRSTAIVVMQGAEFRDATLAFSGADVDRDLWITVTTASVIDVELFLAADAAAPRQVLARASVASDLAPIGRVFRWSGETVDGAAVPAGDHLAFLEVRGDATYVRGGLQVRWTP